MPIYCNYCSKSVFQLDRKAAEDGWSRFKIDLTRTLHREGPESQEIRATFIITHCPDHSQVAEEELIRRVSTSVFDLIGIKLKETPTKEVAK